MLLSTRSDFGKPEGYRGTARVYQSPECPCEHAHRTLTGARRCHGAGVKIVLVVADCTADRLRVWTEAA